MLSHLERHDLDGLFVCLWRPTRLGICFCSWIALSPASPCMCVFAWVSSGFFLLLSNIRMYVFSEERTLSLSECLLLQTSLHLSRSLQESRVFRPPRLRFNFKDPGGERKKRFIHLSSPNILSTEISKQIPADSQRWSNTRKKEKQTVCVWM